MNLFNRFDPETNRYLGHNALALGHAAALAYQEESRITETLDQWGFTESRFLDEGGTQGYIASRDQMLLIAFRGTNKQLQDIVTNTDIALIPGPVGQVHRGFHHGLKQVWPRMLDYFYGMHQGQPVWLTGHSLGAALATLATARFKFDPADQIKIQGLYTFGSPRVGDENFATAFDQACPGVCFRFRNNNDVVTRVPLPGVFRLQYRHVGQLCYFARDGRLRFRLSPLELLWDRFRGRLDDLGKPGTDGMKDHAIDAYLERLEQNQDMTL